MEINSRKIPGEVFMEKKQFEKKPETGGHLGQEIAQVARPRGLTAPPVSVRPSNVVWPSPLAHIFIYPKNLRLQEDESFRETECRHHHDLHLGGQIDPVLHSGEGDFEGFFTVIIANTISINHVLVLHRHV